MSWFEKIMPSRIKTERRTRSVPEGLWIKCPACDAERAPPVQDRSVVAGTPRARRICVQRVVVTGQAIEERGLLQCMEIAHGIGSAFRHRLDLPPRCRRSSESTVCTAVVNRAERA